MIKKSIKQLMQLKSKYQTVFKIKISKPQLKEMNLTSMLLHCYLTNFVI